jgi:hypothetical protein
LRLPVRIGVGEKRQPAILRPRQTLRHRAGIADALGAGARIMQIFDVDRKNRRIALHFAGGRLDPSQLAAVRRNRHFTKLVQGKKRILGGLRCWRPSRERQLRNQESYGENECAQTVV